MRAGIESSVKVKAAFDSRLDTASNTSGILNAVVSTNVLFAGQHIWGPFLESPDN